MYQVTGPDYESQCVITQLTRKKINLDKMRFGFMSGRGTVDVLQRKLRIDEWLTRDTQIM